jgi:hypothetical protein
MNNEMQIMYCGKYDAEKHWQVFRVVGDKEHKLPVRLDLANHSPDGFAWGYGGSGPSQLSLALLVDALGNGKTAEELALAFYQQFKFKFTAMLDQDKPWAVTRERVLAELADAINADHDYARRRIDEAVTRRLYPWIDSWVESAPSRGENPDEIDFDALEFEIRRKLTDDFREVLVQQVRLSTEQCDAVC